MSEDTFKFSIDGVEVEAQKGDTILQAAKRSKDKFDIPYYCWHPELSVVAQCRICQVAVEGVPKLLTACSTPATPDMKVATATPEVKTARAGVMEMFLLNHPLDCPICDKGGECKLQQYTMRYHLGGNSFTQEKNHGVKHKHMGRVVFDHERCIMCTRCTRFDEEVYGAPQIGIMDRGVKLTIDTFDGGDVTHNFSGNFADLCPVGAWTTVDYRFKARPWQLAKTESPCTSCSNGCTSVYWHMKNELHRVTAGENADINSRWICDKGRTGYHVFNDVEHRITTPLVRTPDGNLQEQSWEEAARVAAEYLREAGAPSILTTNLATTEAVNSLIDLSKELNTSLNNSDKSVLIKNWKAVKSAGMDQKLPAIHHTAKRFVVVGLDIWETTPIFALLANRRKRDQGLIIEEIDSLDNLTKSSDPTLLIVGENQLGDPSFSQHLDDLKKKGIIEILPIFEGCNSRGLLELGVTPFGKEIEEHALSNSSTALLLGSDMKREKSFSPHFLGQLSKLNTLILLDDITSPLTEYATVVLPAASLAMTYGGLVSFDNQPQVMKRVLQPTDQMRSVEEIVTLLSSQDFQHQGVAL